MKFILNKIKDITKRKIIHKVLKENKGKVYIIELTIDKYVKEHKQSIEKLGFKLVGKKYIRNIT